MGDQNITAELLKKYHSGLCSPEEIQEVLAWMDSDEEAPPSLHSLEEEQEIEQSLWNSIHRSTLAKDQKNRIKRLQLYRYGIAASLLISLSALFFFYHQNQSIKTTFVNIKNFGTDGTIEKNIGGLILTALPKTNVHAVLNQSMYSGDVSFCDAVLVRNESPNDINLQFLNTCSSGIAKPKNYILKTGITYVAVRVDWKSPEIIVVDQRYLEDLLPLNVAMRINKKIQSI
ncbi:hypothetical protein [Pedobacter steynii]|uniref:Uncharacterized protein n=1 Tax=Pedobacter steynii TaxID=430522 RepID=A0A1D7QKT4_9SPHI|nr:hypothetical protein [Pedobacter steynii]AOM79219.1 hypothetical protein BFS30_19830 [Pedobacter steynii]